MGIREVGSRFLVKLTARGRPRWRPRTMTAIRMSLLPARRSPERLVLLEGPRPKLRPMHP